MLATADTAPSTLAGIIRAGQARNAERLANMIAAEARCRAARAERVASERVACYSATLDRAAEGNLDSVLHVLVSEAPRSGALDATDAEIADAVGVLDAIEAGAEFLAAICL